MNTPAEQVAFRRDGGWGEALPADEAHNRQAGRQTACLMWKFAVLLTSPHTGIQPHLPPPVLFLLATYSFCTRARSEPWPLAAASALSCAFASMREAPMI